MTEKITQEKLWQEIALELELGEKPTTPLRAQILEVKSYTDQLRQDYLKGNASKLGLSQIIGRQFQINDMLLMALLEMSKKMERTESEVSKLRALNFQSPAGQDKTRNDTAPTPVTLQKVTVGNNNDAEEFWPTQDLEKQMSADALWLDMEVLPSHLPLVGSQMTKVKQTLNGIAFYHIQRLSQKQAAVNRVYGEWLLHLNRLVAQRDAAESDKQD